MNLNINTKAFTLTESLINLLLISIVLSLTYGLITMMSKQLTNYQNENSEIISYNQFNNVLLYDIYGINSYTFTDHILTLNYYKGDSITYIIGQDNVYRETQTQTDSFNIKVLTHNLKPLDDTNNKRLTLKVALLKDTIATNYNLFVDNARQINTTLFDEN